MYQDFFSALYCTLTDLKLLRRVEDGLDEDDVAGLHEVEPVGARRDRQQEHLHVSSVLKGEKYLASFSCTLPTKCDFQTASTKVSATF